MLEALDGKLYFNGSDGSNSELYVYEPGPTLGSGTTTAVTSADLNSSGGTNPEHMEAFGGKLYFSGSDGSNIELYVYEPGSTLGSGTTTAVASAAKNSSGSTAPTFMHGLNGQLYFAGSDGMPKLFAYDPVSGDTNEIQSASAVGNSTLGINPQYLESMDGALYFLGFTDETPIEIELFVHYPDDLTV